MPVPTVPSAVRRNVEGAGIEGCFRWRIGRDLNPFVDDSYIGWEAQAGFDWKLLEGMSMNVAYSYWSSAPGLTRPIRSFTYRPTA